jgi:hypothetical protein
VPSEGFHITLEGDKRLVATLKQAARDLGDFRSVNEAAAEAILGVVRPLTPVATGYLQESTTASVDDLAFDVHNEVEYGPVIHNGWPAHNIAPTPFLEEGFADSLSKWSPLYIERVIEIIQEIEGA